MVVLVAYPGGVLRVLEHPPKRFLLGVAIGFIPLQTTYRVKHTEFVHAATPSPRQEGDAMPHLLTLGSKFTTCI